MNKMESGLLMLGIIRYNLKGFGFHVGEKDSGESEKIRIIPLRA
jgi:hypothetical protein